MYVPFVVCDEPSTVEDGTGVGASIMGALGLKSAEGESPVDPSVGGDAATSVSDAVDMSVEADAKAPSVDVEPTGEFFQFVERDAAEEGCRRFFCRFPLSLQGLDVVTLSLLVHFLLCVRLVSVIIVCCTFFFQLQV